MPRQQNEAALGFAARAVHAGNEVDKDSGAIKRPITMAVSLDHDESLIVFLSENDERQYLYPEEFHNGFFRFSVGIEDAEEEEMACAGRMKVLMQELGG